MITADQAKKLVFASTEAFESELAKISYRIEQAARKGVTTVFVESTGFLSEQAFRERVCEALRHHGYGFTWHPVNDDDHLHGFDVTW